MNDKLDKIAIVISIIAIIASFISAWYSFSLNEPYSIPREPDLKIWINSLGYIFTSGVFQISDSNYITSKHSISGENEKIPICIFNDGRDVSGLIYLGWSANWNTSLIVSNSQNIDFIEGGNGKCFNTDIRALCYNLTSSSHLYNSCNENQIKSQIPSGVQTINLSVGCVFCKDRIKTYSFKICIWENNSSECENK